MEVGLIIQDALNKEVKIKLVWLTLRSSTHRRVPKTFGVLAKIEHYMSAALFERY